MPCCQLSDRQAVRSMEDWEEWGRTQITERWRSVQSTRGVLMRNLDLPSTRLISHHHSPHHHHRTPTTPITSAAMRATMEASIREPNIKRAYLPASSYLSS